MGKLKELFSDFAVASRQSGRSVGTLLLELVRLRLDVGRLGVSEYLDFRLHMNNLSYEQKRAFGGYRAEAILEEILIDDYSRFLSLDKITMYALLSGYGLPIPKVRAVYGSKRPSALLCLDSPQSLAHYLQERSSLPVYVKPSFGGYGIGNALLCRLDDGILLLGDGTRVELHEYCRSLDVRSGLGWILQEPLESEPRIAELCGSKLSGVRVHTFLSDKGPVITRAIWKINTGTEDSDNFRDGKSGNLAAALDVRTGEVLRVISGIGLDQVVNIPHPRTGRQLLGFTLPYWEEVRSLVCDAQSAFPGFICPGWDIAVCQDGPRILEINFFGDIDLPQRAYNEGFISDELMSLMRGRGFDGLLSSTFPDRGKSKVTGRIGRRKEHWRW